MKAYSITYNDNLNFFGSMGNQFNCKNLTLFKKAYEENYELALKNALHLRDIREGSGNRQIFRNIVGYITERNKQCSTKELSLTIEFIKKIPEIGRWDDLFSVDYNFIDLILGMIVKALNDKNGLCAKWMPRQGQIANFIKSALYKNRKSGITPKQYRKELIELSKSAHVVE